MITLIPAHTHTQTQSAITASYSRTPGMTPVQKHTKIVQIPILRQDTVVIHDVIPAVLERTLIKRQQPHARNLITFNEHVISHTHITHPQPLQVIQLLRHTPEITDSIRIGVEESPHVNLVKNRILVPEWISQLGLLHLPLDN